MNISRIQVPNLLKQPSVIMLVISNQLSFEDVNELLVYMLINKSLNSKSVGLEKISTKVLQVKAPAVAQPLTKIFNKSVASGQFP